MTENMKRFVEAVQKSEELQNELKALKGKDNAFEEQIAVAYKHGFVLTMEDFDLELEDDAELSLDDLDGAAGGEGWRDRFTDVLNHVYG